MVETIIKWKTGVFSKANAEKCYNEISSLGEEVTPEQVVTKAKESDSELHKCFEWDDTAAAEKYRLHQARNVINSLIVIKHDVKEKSEPVQFRVMMKNENASGTGYKQVISMVRDEDEYTKLLEQAMRELRAFKAKYSCLTELADILALID